MRIDKEDLWLALETADDDLEDGAYWAMVADMLECSFEDVMDAIAEHGESAPQSDRHGSTEPISADNVVTE